MNLSIDDIALAKRALLAGYGLNETADALGLGRQQLLRIALGRTYRQVEPLNRQRFGSGLESCLRRRNLSRRRASALRDAVDARQDAEWGIL